MKRIYNNDVKNTGSETSRDRFRRLASLRTNAVLKRLQVLGNCANRHYYEYSEEDIKKIFSIIEKQMQEVKSRFYFPKEKEFKL